MSIIKKPWSELTDDQKLGEVMNLEDNLRNNAEFCNIIEDKIDQIAKFVQMFTEGNLDADPFIDEIVAIGEWWTNLNNPKEND